FRVEPHRVWDLHPLDAFDLPSGTAHHFILTLKADSRCLPGRYRGRLTFRADGGKRLVLPVEVTVFPDFPTGGLVDVSEYDDGNGTVLIRARIDASDPKRIVIREIPYGSTTETLIASSITAGDG
ncbi:MAG: hypothetical protein DSZ10_02175, partial [Sulfurovum sp.]